jgi:hypothetical protein
MIFTIEQLERFKQYGHRALVRVEEWKGNRDIQVNKIAEEIQGAFSEGYHTAMHEVQSTPWEYMRCSLSKESMDALSAQGWEPLMVAGRYSDWMMWRRRKAVAEIAAKENQEEY